MSIRIANRKKFIASFLVLAVMFLLLLRGLSMVISNDTNKPTTTTLALGSSSKTKTLSVSDEGGIFLEENEHFIKYRIKLQGVISPNFTESPGDIRIKIDGKKYKLNSTFPEMYRSSVYISSGADMQELCIKKLFPDNNQVFIDKDDSTSLIILISKLPNPFTHKIVLDAGHGGNDPGANRGDVYEKDITLKILKLIKEGLLYEGFDVITTREEDVFVSLNKICKTSIDNDPDIFVSIHINENQDTSCKGIDTFYYKSSKANSEPSRKLATLIQKYAPLSDGWESRGILHGDFQVIRDTFIPSVLIECGFVSNPDDRQRLTTDSVLSNLAQNINKGIVEYINSSGE